MFALLKSLLRKIHRVSCWGYLVIVLLSLQLPTVEAQQANNVSVRFSAFSLKGKLGELSFLNQGEVEKLKVGDYRRSGVVEYSGRPELVFFTGPLGEDGKPQDVIARTRLKPRLAQSLLLFVKAGDGYNIIQIEDEPIKFPLGSIRFMNLTSLKHEVYLGIGEEAESRLRIPPLGIRNYSMQAEDHGNLRLRIAKEHDGEVKLLRDCRVFPDQTQRYIYFIYQPNPDKPRLQIASLAGGV